MSSLLPWLTVSMDDKHCVAFWFKRKPKPPTAAPAEFFVAVDVMSVYPLGTLFTSFFRSWMKRCSWMHITYMSCFAAESESSSRRCGWFNVRALKMLTRTLSLHRRNLDCPPVDPLSTTALLGRFEAEASCIRDFWTDVLEDKRSGALTLMLWLASSILSITGYTPLVRYA